MSAENVLSLDDTHTAIHDPVPSRCDTWISDPFGCGVPHTVEMDVQRMLLSLEGVHFSSLQVRRLPDGVCLTGVMQMPEDLDPQIEDLAAQVAGVDRVINHLVVQKTPRPASVVPKVAK
jgi:hypothetical protein